MHLPQTEYLHRYIWTGTANTNHGWGCESTLVYARSSFHGKTFQTEHNKPANFNFSAATRLTCGGKYYTGVVGNLILFPVVNKY